MEETNSIGYTVRKVGKDMSFVGIHIMDEGLIAFADSKSSLLFQDGVEIEDVKRGKISKMFKNENFIIVTYGNNEIYLNNKKYTMEDYMAYNIKRNASPQDFINEFYDNCSKYKPLDNDGVYFFIIGTKDENENYCIYHIKVDITESINTSTYPLPKPSYNGYFIGGNEKYINIYNLHNFYQNVDIYTYSKHIKNVVELMVELEDCFQDYKYNSVGLPINIEIFQ